MELDDGVAARLYPDAAECDPLADLMRDFVIHHRGDHAAAWSAGPAVDADRLARLEANGHRA